MRKLVFGIVCIAVATAVSVGGCFIFDQKPVCPDKTLSCTNDQQLPKPPAEPPVGVGSVHQSRSDAGNDRS